MGRPGRVAVFLQARIGSTRLPSKALFRLGNFTAIGQAMERLKKIEADFHVLLTDRQSIAPLMKEAGKHGFDIMSGPADDVLKRFAVAVEKYGTETVVRATGDNPLVFYRQAEEILEDHLECMADHSWFTGMPLGAGVEIINAEKLLQADREAMDPYEREHVTPYLYRNPDLFRMNHKKCPEIAHCPESRITMDTMTDFLYLKRIFDETGPDVIDNVVKLIEWIKKNPHPETEP